MTASLVIPPAAATPHLRFHRGDARYAGWRRIGSGGSAEVFAVHDRELGVPLAIKLLRPELAADPGQIDALRREVLISRALRHPNICPIHDLYEGPRGVGVVMDLLAGQDLRGWMDARRGQLLGTLDARLDVLRRIIAALEIAHEKIIHRDLKPANVFLVDGDPRAPLIMDFGLSVLGRVAGAQYAGGTPKYMAPEQRDAPASVDHRADLFSFGVLAYELLTDGDIPASSLRAARDGPTATPPPSARCAAIPPALDRLVLQLVERDRDRRPSAAAEVREVLDATEKRDGLTRSAVLPGDPARGVLVPAGRHQVGSARLGAALAEKPRRTVRLSAFRIAAHPVSNAEYARFVAATGYTAPPLLHDARFGQPEAPVVCVRWADAAAYARWAGARLPSEIEWEAAARAGDADAEFPWGSERPTSVRANIDRVVGAPTPNGSYPGGRNRLGLWDLCGNVWEWCADPWEATLLRRLPEDARDPLGQGATELRAIRGGSFDSFPENGRCGFRGRAPAEVARPDIGFRLAFGSSGDEAGDAA